MSLIDYNDQNVTFIEGKRLAQFMWEFNIPDSIVLNSQYMMLAIPTKDTINNAYHQLRFFRSFGNRNNSFVNIGIQGKQNHIKADYSGQTLYEGESISKFLKTTDSTVVGNIVCDNFNLIAQNDSSDVTVRSLEPNFCWFTDYNNQTISYDEHLKSYINLAKKYPQSRYLITYMALNLDRFKTRKDVKSIYDNLLKTQNTVKWYKKIEHYLSGDFVNSSLINLDTKRFETIVQDSSKYNLVTFSASWCIPCIKEIPILKSLYADLYQRIDFTYISIDKQKDVKAFQNLAIKYNIPWRSLYAYKDLERVKDLYFAEQIPHSLLIHPDGHMEIIEVRNSKVREMLYLLK